MNFENTFVRGIYCFLCDEFFMKKVILKMESENMMRPNNLLSKLEDFKNIYFQNTYFRYTRIPQVTDVRT